MLPLSICVWTAVGCGGTAISGAVANQEMLVKDGFYTEFVWENRSYTAVVLTDLEDACAQFQQKGAEVGPNLTVFQLWLSSVELEDYPVYSQFHFGEAADQYALAFYTVHINSTEVVNTEGVAGVVQVRDFSFEDKTLSGTTEVVFGGNGNSLSGSFLVPNCELDWGTISRAMLSGVI